MVSNRFFMKKSLYTLSALVVMTGISQAATLWTTTFSNAAQSDATQVTLTNTLDPSISGSVTGSVVSLNKSTYGASSSDVCSLKVAGSAGTNGALFVPEVNVQNAGSWEVGFSFTNNTGEELSISSIQLTMVSCNGGGQFQTVDRELNLKVTIDGMEVTGYLNVPAHSNENGAELLLTFDNVITFNSDTTKTVTVQATRTDAQQLGSFFGIKSMEVQSAEVVPEPATTSLSLLGLMSLMIRRRR